MHTQGHNCVSVKWSMDSQDCTLFSVFHSCVGMHCELGDLTLFPGSATDFLCVV